MDFFTIHFYKYYIKIFLCFLALTFDSCTPQIKNQSHTQHEKIPSLFESDSETEIDCFQIYCNKNSNQFFLILLNLFILVIFILY